jgi:transposase
MCLKVNPLPPIPADTAQLVQQLLPASNLFRVIGDQLSELGSDADFADRYPAQGRPALSPALLALVLVFQFLEQLGDRQAAAVVVSRLDWTYAVHRPLAAAGCDHSVLCEFRQRYRLHHLFLATAVNLKRAVAWLSGRRPQSERQPGLRRLAAAT